MKKLMRSTLMVVLLIAVSTSCDNNVEEDNINSGTDECPDISFSTQVKPVIDNNCISCHNGSQFPDLRTYDGVSNNAAIVKDQVVNRTMPIGGSLTNEEIELISCWVDNGALNN
ncbi:cytochrome c [Abyssalbus ytuae]|uniref:Cytochrome c n=1 Tax=Abyssalbus ytuae TaxID=2926907 RepID=A0A9E6ZUM9_9FLAO|nr:cytochrome c [Abyssalbus ytuae]UOB18118.1 cytochrome c [Abyssalbus ytuae]